MPIIRDIIYGAAARGASLEELCIAAEVDVTSVSDSERKLDFVHAYQVWEQAVRLTKDKLLGLHLGESTNPTILGLVGHLMQSSPTLKDAFENVAKFSRVATDMFTYSISKKEDVYILRYDPAPLWIKHSPESAQQAIGQAMAGTLNVFYLLSGQKIRPSEVNFSCRRPSSVSEYERIFSCPIHFNARSNELIFPASRLEKSVTSHDLSLYKVFTSMLSGKTSSRKTRVTFADELKQIVLKNFAGLVPPVEVLASHVGVSTRSLQRRLTSEKKTYRTWSGMLKKEMAQQLLRNREIKIGHVADILGYSEASAFRRAYKSWTGSSPRKNNSR